MTRIALTLAFVGAMLALTAPTRAQMQLSWYTIDAGGGTSSAGGFTLTGTIGQHDAGRMAGEAFEVRGGFWSALGAPPPPCPADYNSDGFVTGDDFDSFVIDFELGNPGADADLNGFINGEDFDYFAAHFNAGC